MKDSHPYEGLRKLANGTHVFQQRWRLDLGRNGRNGRRCANGVLNSIQLVDQPPSTRFPVKRKSENEPLRTASLAKRDWDIYATGTEKQRVIHDGRPTGTDRSGIHLVCCVSVLHYLPRGGPRVGRQNRRGRYSVRGRAGIAQSGAAYPARTVGGGGFSDPLADRDRQSFWLGQRALRSLMGAAASSPSGVDGAGGTCYELHADAYRGCGAAAGVDLPLASRG